jgi:F-type H+-transporting ATPase subunit b
MNFNLTLIGQMISFAVFVWFTMTYVWTPIVKALDARKTKVAEGLAAAEHGHKEQELGRKRALESMHAAKVHASEVIGQAQRRATEIIEQAKQDARAEGEGMLVSARAELEQETNRAREGLREKVGELAVAAAQKILEKEINAAAHKSIVDSFAKQI